MNEDKLRALVDEIEAQLVGVTDPDERERVYRLRLIRERATREVIAALDEQLHDALKEFSHEFDCHKGIAEWSGELFTILKARLLEVTPSENI